MLKEYTASLEAQLSAAKDKFGSGARPGGQAQTSMLSRTAVELAHEVGAELDRREVADSLAVEMNKILGQRLKDAEAVVETKGTLLTKAEATINELDEKLLAARSNVATVNRSNDSNDAAKVKLEAELDKLRGLRIAEMDDLRAENGRLLAQLETVRREHTKLGDVRNDALEQLKDEVEARNRLTEELKEGQEHVKSLIAAHRELEIDLQAERERSSSLAALQQYVSTAAAHLAATQGTN